MKQEIKNFIENLSNDFIVFKEIEINSVGDLYQIRTRIVINRLNIIINYGMAIPIRIEKLTDNLKESLINGIKIDINKYIVELVKLDKLGE